MSAALERRDDDDSLPNPRRGCGHLVPGKAYLVGGGFSPDGVLPSWVELDPYLPYREIGTGGEFTRGFQRIDGLTLQLALDDLTDFVPHYPDELHGETRAEAHERALQNHLDAGVYENPQAQLGGEPSLADVPEREVDRHIDRLRHRGVEGGEHWGEVPVAEATDMLMRAGATYYETPADYAEEAIEYGLSKAIPVTPNRDPPVVVPGITRCWIMHPDACEGYGGGIIGYAYLSEVAFTEPDEGEVPAYVEEAEEAGKLAVRDFEAPAEPEDDSPDAALDDFDAGDGGEGE